MSKINIPNVFGTRTFEFEARSGYWSSGPDARGSGELSLVVNDKHDANFTRQSIITIDEAIRLRDWLNEHVITERTVVETRKIV